MKTIIYILLFCLPTIAISNNNNICLEIYGKIKSHKKILNEVTIEVIKNGELDQQLQNTQFGRFRVLLNKGYNYKLVFKKQGYFCQNIEVNTISSEIEDNVWDFNFLIDMLPVIEAYNSSIMSKPFISLRYSLIERRFVKEINQEMLNIYNEITFNYKKLQNDRYAEILNFADAAFKSGDLSAAQRFYEKAEILNPTNLHADVQLVMIDRIKKIDAKNNKKYDELIIRADQYYETKDLIKAKKFYSKALNYKDDDYPRHKMATIKETITLKEVLTNSN